MTIACEHSHHVIPESRRCLYSTDSMGRIDGCRSLSHLQDCGKRVPARLDGPDYD